MRLGTTGFSYWGLIFVIFRKLLSTGIITLSLFYCLSTCIWSTGETNADVKHVRQCHSITIITSSSSVTGLL